LAFVADRSGAPAIQSVVASNWFRGGVTGLGVMNLVIAVWELAHFNQSVRLLRGPDPGKRS
jgi:hypothetical protein